MMHLGLTFTENMTIKDLTTAMYMHGMLNKDWIGRIFYRAAGEKTINKENQLHIDFDEGVEVGKAFLKMHDILGKADAVDKIIKWIGENIDTEKCLQFKKHFRNDPVIQKAIEDRGK